MERTELESILRQANIPLERWGIDKAKTMDHLLEEVSAGETTLSLLREVSVVSIEVTCIVGEESFILREEKQVFSDGRERCRNLGTTMGEKIQPGETPLDAAKRAIREELGIVDPDLVLVECGFRTRGPEESPSYPGLLSLYKFSHFSVTLPTEHYRLEGYIETQGDKTTYFVWR